MTGIRFFNRLAIAVSAASLLPFTAIAEDAPAQPDFDLLTRYEACSSIAAERGLPPNEARECAGSYMLLKLSFLPEINLEDFNALKPAERHTVNQDAYAAYRAWQEWLSEREYSADYSM